MKKFLVVFLANIIILSFLVSCRESISEPGNENIKNETPIVAKLKEIQEPSERVTWNTGESHIIEWEITDNLENIRIFLLRKFVQVAIIEDLTPNDGIHAWTIPIDLPPSHHYRIQLTTPTHYSGSATSVEFEIFDAH